MRCAWQGARGHLPPKMLHPVHGNGSDWWCLHSIGGLEVLAAEEVAAKVGGAVHAMVGRVIFQANGKGLKELRGLRSATMLSLLVWAAPAPCMPGEEEALRVVDKPAAAAKWMQHYVKLLREHVLLERLERIEAAWRCAIGSCADGAATVSQPE